MSQEGWLIDGKFLSPLIGSTHLHINPPLRTLGPRDVKGGDIRKAKCQMLKLKCQIKSKVKMSKMFWILNFDIHLAFGF
jgi:hypothetical protein